MKATVTISERRTYRLQVWMTVVAVAFSVVSCSDLNIADETSSPPVVEQRNETVHINKAVQVSDEEHLRDTISSSDKNTTIEFTGDIQLSAALIIPENKRVTLRSAGDDEYTLTAEDDFDTIIIENGACLTIEGVQVLRLPNTVGRGIHNSGEFIFKSGLIAGHVVNNAEWPLGNGGGVYNGSGAHLTMHGGTIAYNNANEGGGVCNFGEFNMNDGIISENASLLEKGFGGSGGGVYNSGSEAMFTMKDGKIARNKSEWGGGVLNVWGGVSIYGGSISYNEATYGGGIYNWALAQEDGGEQIFGYLNLYGGTISHNTASYNGGGIYNNTYGIVDMQEGTITHNNAYDGGGVYNIGEFHMGGGRITSNTGINGVGGVRSNSESALFNHARGEISDNRPSDSD